MSACCTISSNVVWHQATVTRARRETHKSHRGAIIWFTGLSGSGSGTAELDVCVQQVIREMVQRSIITTVNPLTTDHPPTSQSMTNIAIRVSNLSKCYQIYDNPRDRLKQFVMPKLCRAILALRKFFPGPSLRSHHSALPTSKSDPTFYKEFWALKDVSFEIKKGETAGSPTASPASLSC